MRRVLSTSASLLAVAAMLAAAPPRAAHAQSFNATGTITAGSAIIDVATAGQTNVIVDTPSAVIDWNTNEAAGSGPINFQPAGTTATYVNGNASDFAVLNRIIPNDVTRPAQFNGTVISQLANAATGATTRGGTLFFYSPGGILVGPTGVFNVGNLVLTASDLPVNLSAGTFGSGGTYSFLPANPGSRVEISPGAQITAGPSSAYVALVAPRVIQSGTINVDGSAVIVAADASTITFRPSGLFDIQIDQGTSAIGQVVNNTGSITGPAGNAAAAHRVYFVAVPRNDAITMAIRAGSTLGFAVAGAADVDGNAIVLSAGYDVTNGVIGATRSAASAPVASTLTIGAITATSQVTAQATGAASLSVQAGQAGDFASNVSLAGVQDPGSETANAAFVTVSGVGSTLDIDGDLTVRSLDAGFVFGNTPTDSTPARVEVSRGRMTVLGSVTVDASRTGFAGNDVTGGEAALVVSNGGTASAGGNLVLTADGVGEATGSAASGITGSGTGGTAFMLLQNGGTVAVTGNASVRARGFGGEALDSGLIGGAGTGGLADIASDGAAASSLTVGGTLDVLAGGTGADSSGCFTFCGVEGGAGAGGQALLNLTPSMNVTVTQAVTVDATGRGGAAVPDRGQGGGLGIGGFAGVQSTGGSLTARAALTVDASGTGGAGALDDSGVSSATGTGGLGGEGIGGVASLGAGEGLALGGAGSIAVTGAASVLAYGVGGQGGTGGNGAGGLAAVSAAQGSVSGASLGVQAYGTGGASASGGNAGIGLGGTAEVIAYSALEGSSSVTFAGTVIAADGTGGAGSSPALFATAGSAGGTGTGGQARALAEAGNGALSLGGLSLTANGQGGAGGAGGSAVSVGPSGNGGAGGAGVGGTVNLGVVSGLATGGAAAGSASFGATTASANGAGGLGGAGGTGATPGAPAAGGGATGGSASLTVQGGSATFSGAAIVEASALGGLGGAGTGTGGAATMGGSGSGTSLSVEAGSLTGTNLQFRTFIAGGSGGTVGAATLLDQPISFRLNGGSISAGQLSFQATGSAASGALPSVIALSGGNTTLTGDFVFDTPGTLTATFDGADLRSANAAIAASNWLPGTAPAGTPGTLFASGSISLLSAGDIFGNLSVDSGAALAIAAVGRVRLDNLTSLAARSPQVPPSRLAPSALAAALRSRHRAMSRWALCPLPIPPCWVRARLWPQAR
jgi:filamentous hemagglutinin family protein